MRFVIYRTCMSSLQNIPSPFNKPITSKQLLDKYCPNQILQYSAGKKPGPPKPAPPRPATPVPKKADPPTGDGKKVSLSNFQRSILHT